MWMHDMAGNFGTVRSDGGTYRRAMERGHVTFGFIGGSITDPRGRERWSEYFISCFVCEHPDITVDVENAAIAATGSDYGIFRVGRDIVGRGCDVVFVEYAVNDRILPSERRNRSREGLIRKILTGTDADVVLVYTYCAEMLQDLLKGTLPDTVAELERIAEYYRLSSVFAGAYALSCVQKGLLRWEEWLPDGLHPAHVGSRFYAEAVYTLTQALTGTKERGVYEKALPKPLFPGNWEHAVTLPLDQVRREGYWRMERCLDLPLVERVLRSDAPGSALRFVFEGTGIVLTRSFGTLSSDFRWRVDEEDWRESDGRRPDWMAERGWLKTETLTEELASGPHVCRIEILPPDAAEITAGCTFDLVNIGILRATEH